MDRVSAPYAALSAATSAPIVGYMSRLFCITVPVFTRLGLYRAVVRFLGIHAALAIALGVSVSTLALLLINQFFLQSQVPIAVFAIYFALAVLYVGASRFGARELLRMGNVGARPVAIYGAGAAGAQLCTSLSTSPHFRPLAFVDDNQKSQGARVCGLQVFAPEKLLELRRTRGVQLVFLALPSASRRRRSEIIERLTAQGFKVQTVPDISEIVSGQCTPRRNSRHRRARPARPRSGSAESRAAVRLHPRQVDPGHRRGRFHRFGAVPPDHGAGAASPGAARGFRARALRNRTRAALAECAAWQSTIELVALAGQRAPQASRARNHHHLRDPDRSITRPRTSTCRSSNTT